MKRRFFVKTSLLATAAKAISPQFARASGALGKGNTEFYELRIYSLNSEQQQNIVADYYSNALIPALTRLGNTNTGVFTELKPIGQTKIFTLISYESLDELLQVKDKLTKDKAYLEAGKSYLNAPAAAPAYERIESSLLRAFAPGHKLKVPENKSRMFELRRYENPGDDAGRKKLEMFNKGGEIGIFIRLGFKPVFFGETLIGQSQPNLTYMVTFDDMESHNSHWKAFGSDPEWKKISTMPEYADAKLISKITSTFLTPLSCSQI
jgi:hypothetical protein